MKFHEITNEDKELIQIVLKTLAENFDDGVYHHTVGAARDLLPFAWKPVIY